MTEFIVYAYSLNGSRALFAETSTYSLAETADDIVLLYSDNLAGFLS